jgi:hypothetical protein
MLLDASGKEYTAETLRGVGCPRCGRNGERVTTKGFGGFWTISCPCGHEYNNGRGELPEEAS